MANGLTQLGQALAGGARDYANLRLSREAEERQRAQQLQDVASQRAYADSVYSRERADRSADLERQRRLAREDVTIEILLKEGWLKPTEIDNAAAIQAAADARAKSLGEQRSRAESLPGRLQSEADLLAQRDAELAEAERTLSQKLSEPEPPPPSVSEVTNLALRMTGKPNPSREEIASYMDVAAEQIQNQRLQRWFQEQQEAKTQIPLLRAQRSDITRNLTFMFQQGVTPNRPVPRALTAPAPTASATPRNPISSFTAELDRELANRGVRTERPAPVDPVVAALPSASGADRELLERASQERSARQWNQEAATPWQQAVDRVQQIRGRLQGPANAPVASGSFFKGEELFRAPSLEESAQGRAAALLELQQAVKDEATARRRMFGIPDSRPLAPARWQSPASALSIP